MIRGLCITPPVLGRISIGKVVERNGKRLPEKDDQFTITSQVQTRDGWLPHPYDEALRKAQGGKIRSIPIQLLFNEPELNFRAEYSLFDRMTGRPLCVGSGDQCRRVTEEGVKTFPCPSPEGCPLAQGGACKPYGRLNVVLGYDDPLGSFVFRTTGFNSIRTLYARLEYFRAVSGNRLACMPLELRLRGKSTRQSHGTPIYYVDITLRGGMTVEEALQDAKQLEAERKQAGFDQAALDAAVQAGLANGAFEEGEEDGGEVVEEFYPAEGEGQAPSSAAPKAEASLTEKLMKRAAASEAGAAGAPRTVARAPSAADIEGVVGDVMGSVN